MANLNATQTNTRVGDIALVSAADLTGYEARLVVPGSTGVNLPTTVDACAPLLVVEVESTTRVVCRPMEPGRNVRIVAKSTGSKGDKLVLALIAGTDAGKVRKLPTAAGRYQVVAIAEEDFVDGQHVLCRPFSETVYVGGKDLGTLAADPSAPVEGDRWYNTTDHAFKFRGAAATFTIANILAMFLAVVAFLALAPAAAAADKTPMVLSSSTTGAIAAAVLADNVKIPGTLEVTGASTLTGNVTMSGDLAVTGTLTGSSFIGRVSRTFAFGDMTDNTDATGYIDIVTQIPAGALVLGWKVVTTTGFTGDTTAVVSVGKSGALTCFSTTTNGSVAAAGTVGSASVLATSFCAAATTVRVTITGGADFTSISAGAATVTVFYAY
jgi:hypothetical protein